MLGLDILSRISEKIQHLHVHNCTDFSKLSTYDKPLLAFVRSFSILSLEINSKRTRVD